MWLNVVWYDAGGVKIREATYELGRKAGTETIRSSSGAVLERWEHGPGGTSVRTTYGPDGAPTTQTKWRDLVRVYEKKTPVDKDGKKTPVAFFAAPSVIQTLACAGDKIAVGLQNGGVLHLRAAFLAAGG